MRVACYTRKSSALEKPALWSEIHSLAAMAGLRPSATKPRLAPFPTLLRQTEDFSRARSGGARLESTSPIDFRRELRGFQSPGPDSRELAHAAAPTPRLREDNDARARSARRPDVAARRSAYPAHHGTCARQGAAPPAPTG